MEALEPQLGSVMGLWIQSSQLWFPYLYVVITTSNLVKIKFKNTPQAQHLLWTVTAAEQVGPLALCLGDAPVPLSFLPRRQKSLQEREESGLWIGNGFLQALVEQQEKGVGCLINAALLPPGGGGVTSGCGAFLLLEGMG